MSLFGNLFDDNDDDDDAAAGAMSAGDYTTSAAKCADKQGVPVRAKPPEPRPEHGLCGIYNRGATCYLNSLLQTLAMTPEFCRCLFQLNPEELGYLSDLEIPGVKVRVIPLQLQRLFARLLMLEVCAVSTAELTSSFGWNNQEERDQHDIQELNRILFSAVEESLVGTSGESLIRDLYHGKMTNAIRCNSCGAVSEHSEDFLDLCVSVSGSSRLEDSLVRMFLDTEVLDASNQYRCDRCGQLADATKSTRLRHVPPILTISLLRFNYDPIKMQRYKEMGHFAFPLQLDMLLYCDSVPHAGSKEVGCSNPSESLGSGEQAVNVQLTNGTDCGEVALNTPECGDARVMESNPSAPRVYELFSVVVHRGGAHGGHYHALIRDLAARGNWSTPDIASNQQTLVTSTTDKTKTASPASCSNGVVLTDQDVDSPKSIVTSILLEAGATTCMTVDDLSMKILSVTGQSWKKRYRTKYGSIIKFLASNNNAFVYDSTSSKVSLVPDFQRSKLFPESTTKVVNAAEEDSGKSKRNPVSVSPTEDLDMSSPRAVISSILATAGSAGLSVTDLCSKIADVTGSSWRKCYKPKHGSLMKFLGDNSDRFVYDVSGGWVELARHASTDVAADVVEVSDAIEDTHNSSSGSVALQHPDVSSTVAANKPRGKRKNRKSKPETSESEMTTKTFHVEQNECTETLCAPEEKSLPAPGSCWFDFNDASIHPVFTDDIQKHFSGKECAYMLFYRATQSADSGCSCTHMEIPDWLISEITEESYQLKQQRAEYEESVNVVAVEIHFGVSYEYCDGVLRPRVGACHYVEESVDLRQDANYLLQVIGEIGGELVEQCRTVHTAKSLPHGGIHLYQELTADLNSTLKSSGLTQGTKLFVWNGREVDGTAIPVGHESEPVSLKLEVDTSPEILTVTVPKNTTISALRTLAAAKLKLNSSEKIQLYRRKESSTECVVLTCNLNKTVQEAGLRAKDKITICRTGQRTPTQLQPLSTLTSNTHSHRSSLPQKINIYCENHLGNDVVMFQVEVESSTSVEELKVLVMTSADVAIELAAEVRLRVRLDELGIRGVSPPLHESVDIASAGLRDSSTLVLESGRAPQATEVTLTVSFSASNELEFTVDHEMAIHQLLHEVLLQADTSAGGDEWHLCRSDWTGDAGAVLSEPNKTIGDAGLNHGDRLYLRPGCPPPPGFLKLLIRLLSSTDRLCWCDPERSTTATHISGAVGSVQISKQSTLAELKEQVMTTLPGYEIPSPQFLRLWVLTSKLQRTGILREHNQMLSKLKIGSDCVLGAELLTMEEDLSREQMVLVVRRRLPGERSYGDLAQEVIWDTAQGATVSSLRKTVAEAIGETETGIRMAKHIPDKFEWVVIPSVEGNGFGLDQGTFTVAKKKRKKKGKNVKPGGSISCDLKSAPFRLQDGDIIGVKVTDEPGGEDDDFCTPEDDLGKDKIMNEQKETAAMREAMKKSETKASTSARRPETAIKIHVDNFR